MLYDLAIYDHGTYAIAANRHTDRHTITAPTPTPTPTPASFI